MMKFIRSIQHRIDSINYPFVFMCLTTARILSALYNPIDDCDEVYNFYEPLHKVLYDDQPSFQTWEYSPHYAMRSYAYLLLHALPLYLIPITYKILAFYLLRILFGIICATCESLFYRAIQTQLNHQLGQYYFLLTLFSCALFRSSTMFLNNTFAMYMIILAYTCWFMNYLSIAVFFIAFGALCGWVYVALLGLPIAFDILFRRKKFYDFVKWSIVSALITIIPFTIIDSYYYGKLVITPFNHIKYNIFSKHGPTLYGTEPWTYYLTNGILNFNIVYPLAFIGLLITPIIDIWIDRRYVQSGKAAIPYTLIMSSVTIWMGLLWLQPHKEDRFVSPVYPFILLDCAIIIQNILNVMPRLTKKFRSVLKKQKFILLNDVQIQKTCLLLVIFIVHALLSLSRTIAIIRGYSGSMRLLRDVNTTVEFHQNLESPLNVCIGKDWYRFPSHFFLPERYQLQFIRSEFRGQLPKHYSRLSNATKIIHNDLNDENKEEISHYVDITNCQYIIDHDSPEETKLEPNYAYYPNMKQISATKMILSSKSHAIFRAFYVPFLTEMYTKQTYLHLLRNNQQDANE